MPTAWQLLMKKLQTPEPPQTKKVLNPFNARIGSSVHLDVIDFSDKTFFVKEIREVSRWIGTENYKFTDYQLLARPIRGDDVWVYLRLMPVQNADKHSDLTHNCLFLQKYDELAFNQDFRNLLDDPEFITNQDGQETGHYWRINDVKLPYDCQVKTITADNEKSETIDNITETVLWDYWREYPDEAKQITKGYFYVEMDKENGYFTMLVGEEISPERVNVI